MRHLHALESNHFNAQFIDTEHVFDVLKIEHDIMDVIPASGSYGVYMVVSPSLHALFYQLCILYM
jgi:hypothetical protein